MGDADDFGRTFFMAGGVGDEESAASTGEPLINATATVAVTDATAAPLTADSAAPPAAAAAAAADTSPDPRPDGGVMPLFELALFWCCC